MGYNGGINKRGYYRRNNGMYSKSSMKYGNKILTNFISGGISLLSIFANTSTSNTTNYYDATTEHFNPKKERIKYIVCSTLAILSPILGFYLYVFMDWWMFFSVILSLLLEFVFCAIIIRFNDEKNDELYLNQTHYYIYSDEIENFTKEYKINFKILKGLSITLLILNLYPFFLLTAYYCNIWWGWSGENIFVIGIIISELCYNIAFIIMLHKEYITANTYDEIITREETQASNKKDLTPIKKEKEINSKLTKSPLNEITPKSTIKLSKINGEYVEEFKSPYGKLHIKEKSASIQFYFPGIDARYNGTFFSISETDIDKYIKAYTSNWKIAEELQNKAQEIPNTEIKQSGAMNMNIIVTNKEITLFLHKYHLPIRTKAECEEIINLFLTAKLRIKEIQNKLFT